jgi:hypothetical protein
MPRANALLRLTCAASAVLTTALIGLSIHSLARTYDLVADTLAATGLVVVARAQPR